MRPLSIFCSVLAMAALLSSCGEQPSDSNSGDKSDGGPPQTATKPAPAPETKTEVTPALTLVEQGRRNFRICAACHAVDDPTAGNVRNLVGPNLFGIVGAPSAREEGFAYSKAMSEANLTWDRETLDAFIANPQQQMRGNRMGFAGERNAERRAAIITYLESLN